MHSSVIHVYLSDDWLLLFFTSLGESERHVVDSKFGAASRFTRPRKQQNKAATDRLRCQHSTDLDHDFLILQARRRCYNYKLSVKPSRIQTTDNLLLPLDKNIKAR